MMKYRHRQSPPLASDRGAQPGLPHVLARRVPPADAAGHDGGSRVRDTTSNRRSL